MIRQVLWLVILEHLWTVMWNYVGQRALLWHLKSYFVQFLTYKCFIHKWHFHAIIYYHLRSLILLSLYLFSRAPDATGSWTIKKKMKWIYRKYLCVGVWWWWGGTGTVINRNSLRDRKRVGIRSQIGLAWLHDGPLPQNTVHQMAWVFLINLLCCLKIHYMEMCLD